MALGFGIGIFVTVVFCAWFDEVWRRWEWRYKMLCEICHIEPGNITVRRRGRIWHIGKKCFEKQK